MDKILQKYRLRQLTHKMHIKKKNLKQIHSKDGIEKFTKPLQMVSQGIFTKSPKIK